MKKIFLTVTLLLIFGSMLPSSGCDSGVEEPQTAADFYEGKTINLIVSSSAGSTSDLCARVIASYLERDTGAGVLVTNEPGAGGLDGMNHLYRGETDGLMLGVVSSVKLVSNIVLDEPAAVYELEEFSYLLNIGGSPYLFVVSPEGNYRTLDDILACEGCLIGGASPAGPLSLGGLTAIEILDIDAKVITGITTITDLPIMTKRGEIIGYFFATVPSQKSYLDSGMIEPVFVLSTERDPLMPGTPAITELVSLSDEDLELVELWAEEMAQSYILAAPPGVPADRMEFLNGLVEGWTEDEEFRNDIDVVMGYEEVEYETGDVIARDMQDLAESLDDYRARFTEMIEKYRI